MKKSNWKKCKLGDIVNIKGGKRLPIGETLVKYPTQHPYLRVRDFTQRFPMKEALEYVTDATFSRISRYVVKENDVVLSIVGSIGLVAYINKTLDNTSLTENAVRLFSTNIVPLFLYYWLLSPEGQSEIAKNTVGAVQAKLPIYGIQNINILLPPLDEQKRIAEVLGAFDDKIELLQKQNKTLEEMAKATFKSWFVDFDVVKAKSSILKSVPLVGKVREAGKGENLNSDQTPPNGLSATSPAGGEDNNKNICPPCGENIPQGEKGVNKPAHQPYSRSIKCLVRSMRQHLTPQEVKLWQHIRKEQLGVKFRRQYPINNRYIADFVCLEKKLIIELDGSQHAENKHDIIRSEYLQELGFSVVRFWNTEIDNNLMGCLEVIKLSLNSPLRPTATSPASGEDNRQMICPPCGENVPQGQKGVDFKGTNTTPPIGLSATSPAGVEDNNKNTTTSCGENNGWTKEKIMREYHLTEELYNLFPSSFTDSPLGPIPLGWEVKKLGNYIKFVKGKKPLETSPIAKETFLPQILIETLDTGKFLFASPDKMVLTDKNNLIMVMDGASSGRIGKGLTGIIGSTLAKIQINELPISYVYCFLKAKEQDIKDNTTGTSIPHVDKGRILNYDIFVPPYEILNLFHILIDLLYNKQDENTKQIQTLTELRDLLLPRLISGKIRV